MQKSSLGFLRANLGRCQKINKNHPREKIPCMCMWESPKRSPGIRILVCWGLARSPTIYENPRSTSWINLLVIIWNYLGPGHQGHPSATISPHAQKIHKAFVLWARKDQQQKKPPIRCVKLDDRHKIDNSESADPSVYYYHYYYSYGYIYIYTTTLLSTKATEPRCFPSFLEALISGLLPEPRKTAAVVKQIRSRPNNLNLVIPHCPPQNPTNICISIYIYMHLTNLCEQPFFTTLFTHKN